jgi:chemotaxis protein methyltransferase CheR
MVDDYTDFCEGVRRLTRIDLGQYKRGQMERRIRSFASRLGEPTLHAYLGVLRREPARLEEFLDRITINVSQLWRNPEQWELLAEKVLPGLAREGRIRAWSAGCSYGAEAFTLAAVCRSAVPAARLEIAGTDIDSRMVERARQGRFSLDDARDVPQAELARWFRREGDEWVAQPELSRLVRFETGDLLRIQPRPAALDLVLCRNTVIYFDEDVRNALHARLAASLRSGGHLVVGSTERVARPAAVDLEPVHPFVYRKR